MSISLRTLALGVTLALSQGTANAATLKNIQIGNWFAGAYSDDQTGAFSHCAASSSYRNGLSMIFAINKSYAWSVGFSSPKWNLVKGSKYPISMRVDGSGAIDETAVVISSTFVEASLPDSSALFNAIKYGRLLTVYAADQTFEFRLTDTSQLLPSLLECVKKFDQRQPETTANPFVAPTPAPTPGPAADTAKIDASDETAGSSSDRRLEATSLIANILAKSGVSGFEILGADAAQKFKSDAAWRAGDSFGTMQIISDPQSKPDDLKASILASDSKACHDKFFSGSMPDTSGNRLFTSCRSDAQTTTIFYSMIKRAKGGYYVLATGGLEHSAQGDGKPIQTLDNGIRSAAYREVTH